MAGIALSAASSKVPVEPPCVLLSGGETTVTVRGTGTGGRNREFALSLAIALAGRYDICAIACDTDGIDGAPDAAGAIVLPDTIARARQKGLDPHLVLMDNDAGGLFGRLGDQVVTGPTGTNLYSGVVQMMNTRLHVHQDQSAYLPGESYKLPRRFGCL